MNQSNLLSFAQAMASFRIKNLLYSPWISPVYVPIIYIRFVRKRLIDVTYHLPELSAILAFQNSESAHLYQSLTSTSISNLRPFSYYLFLQII